MSNSEEELFLGVREGRGGAWEKLVEHYAPLVYAVPRQLGLSAADAEEVSQSTWMIVHRHLRMIAKPGSLANWLITTASRETWKLQRARSRRERIEAAGATARSDPSEDDPAKILERLERAQLVREALDELPARCAKLLRALYLGSRDASYQEVGAALAMPPGSIGPTRIRCLAHLARILEPRVRP